MTEKDKPQDGDHLSVRLNDAFERLEKQHEENLATANPHGTGREEVAVAAPSSVAGVLGVLLSLIAIGIASYAAWTVYLQSHKQSQVEQLQVGIATTQRRMDAYQSQLNSLSRQLKALSGTVTTANAADKRDIAEIQKQLAASIAQMQATMGTSSKDWLYAEVEYLLRLANQRVVMEGNVKGALTLFHDADNIVRQTEGITGYDLRKSIADNIAQLEAVKQVDVDGIYVRLGALVDQVGVLQQRQHRFTPKPVSTAPAIRPGSGFGAQLLAMMQRAGERMATLVDFRRNSEHIQPILPPKEEYYLRQNLVLKIQMAQLALLRGDQAVYANSLKEAQTWLHAHFDEQSSATAAMEKGLAQLEAIDIGRKMPDVSSSLKEVRKLMAKFHEQPAREQQAK